MLRQVDGAPLLYKEELTFYNHKEQNTSLEMLLGENLNKIFQQPYRSKANDVAANTTNARTFAKVNRFHFFPRWN